MDKEKLISRLRKDKFQLVPIPSTISDQERKKIIQDFARKLEATKSSGESILVFIHP